MSKKKRITIVDDDPAIQDTLRTMLELHGYEVTVFDSGKPLLSGDFEQPDLLIMDRQLPGVDGLELSRFLKTQESTKDMPLLILSASPQIGPQAMAALADGFLEKPFRMQVLLDAVARLAG